MTDTADHADYRAARDHAARAPRRAHARYGHTYAMLNQPAIAPLGEAKPNTQIFRELAQRMGFDEPCFADSDEQLARTAFARRRLRRAAARRLGQAAAARGAVRRRRFPDARRQGARRRAGLRRARLRAATTRARARRTGRALSAGDDLAAGAQLPQLELRQRDAACATSRASRCSRSIRDDAAARGIADGAMVRGVQRARQLPLHGRASATRARPGVVNGLGIWWRKFGVRRHQRQRADQPAPHRHRPRARRSTTAWSRCGRREIAARVRCGVRCRWRYWAAARRCCCWRRARVPDQRLLRRSATIGAVGRRAPRPDAARAARSTEWLADATPPRSR